jgi:hypothetical protein
MPSSFSRTAGRVGCKRLLSGIDRVTESKMQDIVFILVTIGFFAVAMAYVRGCNRLK